MLRNATALRRKSDAGSQLAENRSAIAGIRTRFAKLLDRRYPGFSSKPKRNNPNSRSAIKLIGKQLPSCREIKTDHCGKQACEQELSCRWAVYLDIIPVRGGSDYSMRHLLFKWGFAPEQLLVAGDSGNDEGMLKGRTLGVVVGNYSPELEKLRKLPRIYFADGHHARGIIEGIRVLQLPGPHRNPQ